MASYRSEIIYPPPMEANWAKVLGKARVREEGDEPMWSIDLLGDPNDEEITELRNKIRGFMVECHGTKPNVSKNGMPLKRHEAKDDNGEMQPTGLLCVKAKRKLINKALGAENAGPLVVDSQCNKWPDSELIGNGSMVIAKIHFWGWNRGKEGVAGLQDAVHCRLRLLVQRVLAQLLQGGTAPRVARVLHRLAQLARQRQQLRHGACKPGRGVATGGAGGD